MDVQWPLVGREKDLAAIGIARTGSSSGGLLLAGPSGVGKTRLAREATAIAEAEDVPVRWARANRTASRIPLAAFAPLLPPEREIATLASQGLSSREIAQALDVSPRTVENHLQRAYEKLGVRGRAGLVEALARASL